MDDLAILGALKRNYIRSVQESDVGGFRQHKTDDFGRWRCVAAHVTRG